MLKTKTTKEILLQIDFIKEMRLPEVVKRCHKLCSTILFIRKNTFNSFDYVPLAILRFELSLHQKWITLQNFSQNKQRDARNIKLAIEYCVLYSARNFA